MLSLIFIAILGVVIPNGVLVCVAVFISILSVIMLNVVNQIVVAPSMLYAVKLLWGQVHALTASRPDSTFYLQPRLIFVNLPKWTTCQIGDSTFSIMSFSIMTFSIIVTVRIDNSAKQHSAKIFIKCHYAECRYAKCRYAECR
jgi:hypothetical protein